MPAAAPGDSRDVVPELRKRGVTDDQLHLMLVDNPRRIFA